MDETSRKPHRPSTEALLDEIRPHRGWFLALGIALAVLGAAAILFPFVATLAVALLLGWVLLFGGAAQAVHAWRMRLWRGFVLHTFGALLMLAVGALLLLYPMPSIASLTLLLGAFFIAEGIFRTGLAVQIRGVPGWGWLLTGGIVSLGLGVLVLVEWPEASTWLLGLLVGIDLLFAGWALIGLAKAARHGTG